MQVLPAHHAWLLPRELRLTHAKIAYAPEVGTVFVPSRDVVKKLADRGNAKFRQERGPRQVQAHRNNVTKLDQEAHQAHDAVKQAKMAADEKQLQLKHREAKLSDLQAKLNMAQSNKEYQLLKDQIAADKQANSVLADAIVTFEFTFLL